MKNKRLYVTRPSLPPLEDFLPCVEDIWRSKTLTNNGPYARAFEAALEAFLGVPHVSLFANGTIALMTALRALEVEGEVITTPYSFVATTHALLWNGLDPVFADIGAATCNLDPEKVSGAVTERTGAILPVHCYGMPCDTAAMGAIARGRGIPVIYDAAHAFGVKIDGESLLTRGDIAMVSFHATKAFHTFEGGALICNDASLKARIDRLRNFGFVGETSIVEVGLNGKMSEIHAAFGLLQLKHFESCRDMRGQVDRWYRGRLAGIAGLHLLPRLPGIAANFTYFPVFVGEEFGISRDALYEKLKAEDIFGRRYFFPLISSLPMYAGLPSSSPSNLRNAHRAADSVICLPFSDDITESDVERIADVILSHL